MRRTLIHLAVVMIASSGMAASQSLPDPRSPALPSSTAPDPYRLPNPITSASSPLNAPDPNVARSLAEKVISGLDGLSDTIHKNTQTIRQLKGRIAALSNDRARLEADRAKILDELKKGFYCSTCGRAKSEFASEAEFWAHIREGASEGRRAVPASSEQVKNKSAEFDRKLNAIQDEQLKCQSSIREKNSENKLAYDQLKEGIALWQAATSFEKTAISVVDELNKQKFQDDLSNAKNEISRLDRDIARWAKSGNPDEVQRLRDERAMWQQVHARLTEEAAARIDYYWQNIREAEAKQQTEFENISRYIQRTDDFLYSARLAGDFLPTLNVSVARVGISTNRDQLGIRFNFGRLAASGLDVSNGAASQEVQAFLDLFGTLRLAAGWRTTYGVSGVESAPTTYVGPRPKSSTPLKIDKRVIDEKPGSKLPIP